MTERDALRETAATFVRREVLPHLDDWEAAGEVPRELHRAAARQGLLGVSFPESVGGEGGDLLDSIAVQEAFLEAGAQHVIVEVGTKDGEPFDLTPVRALLERRGSV